MLGGGFPVLLGPPNLPLTSSGPSATFVFSGEGSPTKIDYRKKGALIRSTVLLFMLSFCPTFPVQLLHYGSSKMSAASKEIPR